MIAQASPRSGIVAIDAGLDRLVPPNSKIERLGGGFTWSEGPVWIAQGEYLLLSDAPANTMYRWSEKDGLSVFLKPSGYAGDEPGIFREPGSNGLITGPGNSILMADHGNRAIARLDLATKTKTFLATHYKGKKFNSPNDLVLASDGSIYFTDPPYGLEGLNDSPHKEIEFNGVFRLLASGEVDGSIRRGVGPRSTDHPCLRCRARRAGIWQAGLRRHEHLAKQGRPGLPDGMAIDVEGNICATGPGGVHIYTPAGVRLGTIDTGTAIANCAFGEDGRTLFLASNDFLARVRTNTIGVGFSN
jgi:gluconolactonase